METIQSAVDTTSDEYTSNYAAMERLVDQLQEELVRARTERSHKASKRNEELGKLTVDERLDLLLDPGSPWMEIAPLAARGLYDGKVHGAGSRAGIGMVGGRQVLVHANDPRIKGGTIYPMGVKKTLRCQTIAMDNHLPLIMLVDSGGAFLPLQSEIFPDADDGGRVFYNQAIMSKMAIPQVTAVLGQCTAGAAYIPAMSDHVVHVSGTGGIFLGGPPLVKAATGEEVSAEDLGGAQVHCNESGVSDYFAQDDAHAMDLVRQIVETLPDHPECRAPDRPAAAPLYPSRELWGVVPESVTTPYDVMEVLARLVDRSEVLEHRARYGSTLVCAYAYIHGFKVGILANRGVLMSDSALKATHFIQLCDRDGVPLVFLQNIAGYIVGREYERGGITKDGQKMVHAVATATVPKLTVIIGASYGAGNYGMCGRAYGPRLLWMWPNAKIGVMGGEQAARVLVTVKNDQLARAGEPPIPEQMAQAIREPILAAAEKEGNAMYSTANLWDDGIIDPAKTRDALGLALAVASRVPRSDVPGHGVFRT